MMKMEDAYFDSYVQTRGSWFPGYPSNLAICYEKVNQLEKADKLYQHIVEQEKKISWQRDRVPSILAYADFCRRHGKFKKAETLYALGNDECENSKRWGQYREAKDSAVKHMQEKEFELAEKKLVQAIEHLRQEVRISEFADDADLAPLALLLGKCYLETGQLDLAAHYIKLSFRGNCRLAEAAMTYSQLMSKRGDEKESLTWRERAHALEGDLSQ